MEKTLNTGRCEWICAIGIYANGILPNFPGLNHEKIIIDSIKKLINTYSLNYIYIITLLLNFLLLLNGSIPVR